MPVTTAARKRASKRDTTRTNKTEARKSRTKKPAAQEIEAPKAASRSEDQILEKWKAEKPHRKHVVRIAEMSKRSPNKPARVVILCEMCGGEREIAVQDVFQCRSHIECRASKNGKASTNGKR